MLWDIDGTLLRAGDVAAAVFNAVIEETFGVSGNGHRVRHSGKTDPQIAREVLAALAIDHDESHVQALVAGLERGLAARRVEMRERGVVLPVVEPVLACLHDHREVVNTVLTGNTRANAVLKLETFSLDRWIDVGVGAFGSDDADRNNLVQVALDRVTEAYGPVDRARAWVVGDTPFDATCAQAGGVRCLLVATGRSDRSALEAAGADRVVDDLRDTAAILDLLLD